MYLSHCTIYFPTSKLAHTRIFSHSMQCQGDKLLIQKHLFRPIVHTYSAIYAYISHMIYVYTVKHIYHVYVFWLSEHSHFSAMHCRKENQI